MSSRSVSDSSKAFVDFTDAVTTKLDLFDARSSKEDKSFFFSFIHKVKVKNLTFFSSFFFFSLSV